MMQVILQKGAGHPTKANLFGWPFVTMFCINNFCKTYLTLKAPALTVTDYRLQALDRNRGLKEMWEKELDCDPVDDMELMSIPDKSSYIDFTRLIREG